MEETARKKSPKIELRFDLTLLFLIILLLGIGLIMIYSVSSYEAYNSSKGSTLYLVNQLRADLLGIVVMIIAMFFPYKVYQNRYIVLFTYFLSIVCLCLVPFFGISSHGAKRWLPLPGGMQFQPAELTKIAVILAVAAYTCLFSEVMFAWRNIIVCGLIAGIPAAMVALITDNFSSALIILGIAAVMIFVSSKGYKKFIGILALAALAATLGLYYIFNMSINEDTNFRFVRILAWRNPEKYSQLTGFQTVQALYAIGSGGFWGKGIGQSMQKLGFIPEAQNDMIFSVICEELGLFGAFAIMIIFVALIIKMAGIAMHTKDMHGTMLVTGILAQIAIQVILNIAVVTNTIPNTGVSLPFISYGGTSALFLLVEMGIVMNVGHHSTRAMDREAGMD